MSLINFIKSNKLVVKECRALYSRKLSELVSRALSRTLSRTVFYLYNEIG